MPLKAYRDEPPALNLTPMVDVVFLLIVFFMVGARFTAEDRQIDVTLPTVGSAMALTSPPGMRVIHVHRDGTLEWNGQPMPLDQLAPALQLAKSQHPHTSVAVRGDAQGAFQHVAAVLAACRSAGIRDVAISVQIAADAAHAAQRR